MVPVPVLAELVGSAARRASAAPMQLPTSDYESVVRDDEPVAYWRFGEAPVSYPYGNPVAVEEMNGFDSPLGYNTERELVGLEGAVPGDTSVGFTGGGLGIGYADDLRATGDFSVETWFRVDQLPPPAVDPPYTGFSGIFGFHWSGAWLRVTDEGAVDGGAYIIDGGVGSPYSLRTSVGVVTDDSEWHHVVLTREATVLTIYLDGFVAARRSVPGGLGDWGWGWGAGGVGWGTGAGSVVHGLVGGLDEPAIYHGDNALTHAEVAEHYVASGRSLPGLSEYFGPNGAACFECWVDTAADPVDTAVGNFHYPLPGLSVPGRGPGLFFGAAYNSRGTDHEGALGAGWSSMLDARLVVDGGEATVVQEGGATVPFRLVDDEWLAPPRFTATLVEEGDGTFTFTRQHFETFRFAATGELVGIADVFGNETTISYDGSGLAEFMTDEAGRQLAFVWDGDRLESVTDERDDGAGPRSLEFTYDVSDRLDTFTDADGGVWHFAWSGDLLEEVRRPEAGATGPAVVNVFDGDGRVVSQTDEEDRETTFDYDTPVAGTTRVTMPSGLVRDDVYAGGVLVAQTVGVGTAEAATTSWTRDAATFAYTSMTDRDENTWTYTVDEDGNRLSSTDPTGRVTRWTYNAFDQVTSVAVGETAAPLTVSTAAVVTSTFEFDPDDGRLLTAVTAAGTAAEATTTYQYGDSARPEDVTSIIDGRNKVWYFDYDPDTGDLLESVDPETNATTFGYNSIGWVTSQVSPRGNASGATPADFTTTFAHDGFGRVISASGPEGTASSWDYDGNGNLIETVAGVGSAEELVTTYDHDDSGRLLWEDPPGPGRRDYTTWPDGQQKTFTNELSATWSYGLDDLGRLETVTDPLANVTSYDYDDAGRLGTVTDATGQVTSYLYDEAGRPEVVDYTDPATPDLTAITYDALGRRTAATVGATVETWAWDHANRLTSHVDVNGRTTSYGWDDTNNLTAIGYPGAGNLTRAFDDAGRLESVTDWASRTTTFGYDENGNWDQTTFPAASANVDIYAFDDADRLTSITWRRSTTVQGSLSYAARDGLGNVTSVTATGTAGAGQGWDYDARARLTTAGAEGFGYDAASNITEGPDGVLGVFDPAQRLCWTSLTATSGTCSTPAGDATTFGFDDAGRRTSMTLPSGDTASYGYDGAGRLTEAVLPAPTEAEDRQYQTVTPAVVADTDAGTGTCDGGTCATLVADDPVEVRVAGVGGIPASGVVAVTGTITVTNPTADGFVELNPTGDAAAGVIAAEAATTSSGGFTAALDAEGDLVIEASVGADVVVEVSGYFTPPPIWTPARNYWPVTPTTIGGGSLAAGTTNVTVVGVGDVPATGVSAVTVTVLATASGAGNLRFAPNGAASAGTVSWDGTFPLGSGSYTVPLNGDGTITVAASTATTLSGFSVTGYWAAPTTGDSGLGLELLDGGPARVLDTATGTGTCVPAPCDTVINAAGATQVTVAGLGGVPADAEAVLVSVAATGAGNGLGSVSSTAAGGNVALLAFDAGIVASASVIVPVDDDGTIDLTALYTNAEFTIDVVGHFSRPTTSVTYAYGADGLRTSAQGPTLAERQYTWSATGGLPLLLAEHHDSNTSYLIYGPGGAPLYQITAAGQPVYFHLDHLGSVRHTTHANGTSRGAMTYSAYGEITANTTSWTAEQPLLGYAGEYQDPGTGFIYLRARHYDPATGQFLTRDPLEQLTRSPYLYAGGNPANAVDPTGFAECGELSMSGFWECADEAVETVVENTEDAADAIRDGIDDVSDTIDDWIAERIEEVNSPLGLFTFAASRALGAVAGFACYGVLTGSSFGVASGPAAVACFGVHLLVTRICEAIIWEVGEFIGIPDSW